MKYLILFSGKNISKCRLLTLFPSMQGVELLLYILIVYTYIYDVDNSILPVKPYMSKDCLHTDQNLKNIIVKIYFFEITACA